MDSDRISLVYPTEKPEGSQLKNRVTAIFGKTDLLSDTAAYQKGEYFAVLEKDQTISEETAEKLYEQASAANADILLFNSLRKRKHSENHDPVPGYSLPDALKEKEVFSADECIDRIFQTDDGMACTKLIRTEFFRKLNITECDDAEILAKVSLCSAKRIAVSKDCFVSCGYQEKRKDTDLKALYDLLNGRGLYEKAKKSWLSLVSDECVNMIRNADDPDELIHTDEKIQDILSYIHADELVPEAFLNKKEYARFRSFPYMIDTRRKYLLRKEKRAVSYRSDEDRNIKVSVIIPVYNTEKYLCQCLDSIANQTLKEIEIICVNDGSTDASLQILEEYAKKDSRFSVYSEINKGQSSARNLGLSHAAGRYIYFMDSDDILDLNCLTTVFEEASKRDLDVIYFDGSSFSEDGVANEMSEKYSRYYTREHTYEGTYRGCDLFAEMYHNGEYRVSPCLQLIRRKLLAEKDIWFVPGIIHEDNIFSFEVILQADKAAYTHASLFSRRVRASSTMTASRTYKNVIGYFVCYLEMQKFLDSINIDDDVRDEAAMCNFRILHNARNDYKAITPEERYAYEAFGEHDRIQFRLHVQESIQGSEYVTDLRNKIKQLEKKAADEKAAREKAAREKAAREKAENASITGKIARKVKKMF